MENSIKINDLKWYKRNLYDDIAKRNDSFVFELKDKLIAFGYKNVSSINRKKYVMIIEEYNKELLEKYSRYKEMRTKFKEGYSNKEELMFKCQYNSIVHIISSSYLKRSTIKLIDYIDHLDEGEINFISNQMQLLIEDYKEYL